MDIICQGFSVFAFFENGHGDVAVLFCRSGAPLKGVELFECLARRRTVELMRSFLETEEGESGGEGCGGGGGEVGGCGEEWGGEEGEGLGGWGVEEFMAWMEFLVGVGEGGGMVEEGER